MATRSGKTFLATKHHKHWKYMKHNSPRTAITHGLRGVWFVGLQTLGAAEEREEFEVVGAQETDFKEGRAYACLREVPYVPHYCKWGFQRKLRGT